MCADIKDLAERTISGKVLTNRGYDIAPNSKFDEYQRRLASMVYKFFDKKAWSRINVNEVLAQELHKPVIKKFNKREVYSKFKDNIWAADLAETGSLFSWC